MPILVISNIKNNWLCKGKQRERVKGLGHWTFRAVQSHIDSLRRFYLRSGKEYIEQMVEEKVTVVCNITDTHTQFVQGPLDELTVKYGSTIKFTLKPLVSDFLTIVKTFESTKEFTDAASASVEAMQESQRSNRTARMKLKDSGLKFDAIETKRITRQRRTEEARKTLFNDYLAEALNDGAMSPETYLPEDADFKIEEKVTPKEKVVAPVKSDEPSFIFSSKLLGSLRFNIVSGKLCNCSARFVENGDIAVYSGKTVFHTIKKQDVIAVDFSGGGDNLNVKVSGENNKVVSVDMVVVR